MTANVRNPLDNLLDHDLLPLASAPFLLADELLLLVDDLHSLAGAVFPHDGDDVIPLNDDLVPAFDVRFPHGRAKVPVSEAADLFAKAAA